MPLSGGNVFAGYTIVRPLGSGGMGEVYLAQHPRLPRHDAIKILPARLTADSEFRQRFNREADLASRLWHPHIVGIHDRGEFEGQLWISMDYVEGIDAAQLMRSRYPSGMPQAEVFEIVLAVADALNYAHSQGLLHRDVKPANILLGDATTRGRRILLADFGIARQLDDISGLTATNMTVGTVAYEAPEQLMGLDIDGRADEYALGCTAFHLLTGSCPFQHSNPAIVISQHLSAPPPPIGERRPELAELNAVVAKALAKNPEDRYPNCSDFAAALAGQPSTAPTDTTAAAAGAVTQPAPVSAPLAESTPSAKARQGVLRPTTDMLTTEVVGQPSPVSASAAESTPLPKARRRLLRPATVIPAILVIVLIAVTGVVGAQLLRDHSNKPSSAPPSASEPALRLTRYITDPRGALNPAGRAAVQGAIDKLYTDRKVHLWVAYVNNFSGLGPFTWAQNAMRPNAFTSTDGLLGIDITARTFAFQVPQAVINGTPINIPDLRRNHIEPAVLRDNWSGAAVAAANGLDTPVS